MKCSEPIRASSKGKKEGRGNYAPKPNKFTRTTPLRKRKPRRSGAFVVNWYLPIAVVNKVDPLLSASCSSSEPQDITAS
jgi:hypothetical protein